MADSHDCNTPEEKTEKIICHICGANVVYQYKSYAPGRYIDTFRSMNRQAAYYGMRHIWTEHRSDLPPGFTTFTAFYKWFRSADSVDWRHKETLIADAIGAMRQSPQ